MPHDLRLEAGLLGAMMHYRHELQLLDGLADTTFYGATHKVVWRAIDDLVSQGLVPDLSMVASQIGAEKLADIGGYATLIDLEPPGSLARADTYRERLLTLERQRRVVSISHELLSDPGADLARVRTQLDELLADTDPSAGADALVAPAEGDARWADLPDRPQLVPGMLPIGATILVAAPKARKSWLAQQVEHYLAAGRPLLDRLQPTAPVRCLVVDFEGDAWQLQERSWMLSPELPDDQATFNRIQYVYDQRIPRAGFDARLDWLRRTLDKARHDGDPYGYVRIDTYRRFAGPKPRGQDAYTADYDKVSRLNNLAKATGVAILIVHHTKEGATGYDSVNGSRAAIQGGSEAMWLITNDERQEDDDSGRVYGVLQGEGRSVRAFKLAMEFADGWQLTEELLPAEISHSGVGRDVIRILRQHGPATVHKLKAHAELHAVPIGTVRRTLARLHARGEADRRPKGREREWYALDQGPEPAADADHHPPLDPLEALWDGYETETDGSQLTQSPAPTVQEPPDASPAGAGDASITELAGCSPGANTAVSVDTPDTMDISSVVPAGAAGKDTAPSTALRPASPKAPKAMQALLDSLSRSSKRPMRRVLPDDRGQDPWAAIARAMVKGHRWVRADVVDGAGAGEVLIVDRRGSFPSAMTSVIVGAGRLEPYGPLAEPIEGKAGIYLIEVPPWHDASFAPPLGRWQHHGGQVWVTDPHLALLRRLYDDVPILDSYLATRATTLFRPFSEWARTKRREAIGTPDYAEVKHDIVQAIQMIHCDQPSGIWRPDWLQAIHAEAWVRHWVKAEAANQVHHHVIGLLNEDEAHLLVPVGSSEPPGFKVGHDFGQVSLKGRLALDEWRELRSVQAAR